MPTVTGTSIVNIMRNVWNAIVDQLALQFAFHQKEHVNSCSKGNTLHQNFRYFKYLKNRSKWLMPGRDILEKTFKMIMKTQKKSVPTNRSQDRPEIMSVNWRHPIQEYSLKEFTNYVPIFMVFNAKINMLGIFRESNGECKSKFFLVELNRGLSLNFDSHPSFLNLLKESCNLSTVRLKIHFA